ncbi:MAG: T9SS type A sorting domain-containing protein [Bacteroidales bacterium]|nr:T9SS type A sorting domain-containing protein [Bacteroidales bacterium]
MDHFPFNPRVCERNQQHSQNPVLQFSKEGTYNISLNAKNSLGSDTKVKRSFIAANNQLVVEASLQPFYCFNELIDLPVKVSGAKDFTWHIEDTLLRNVLSIEEHAPGTYYFNLNPNDVDSSLQSALELTGSHGECTSGKSYQFNVIVNQIDNIENAQLVEVGNTYHGLTNYCASVEPNEPNPPFSIEDSSCFSRSAWCFDIEDANGIVDNSVWFTFVGPPSGYIGLEAPGFDTQIAIYEAQKAEDILSGNQNLYKIIAANDDYVDTINFGAAIASVKVEPGKQYWLQVDGSNGGELGYFSLVLTPHTLTPVLLSQTANNLLVFPNPANDYLNLVIDSSLAGSAQVRIVNAQGHVVKKHLFSITENISIPIDISDLIAGTYVVQLISAREVTSQVISIK